MSKHDNQHCAGRQWCVVVPNQWSDLSVEYHSNDGDDDSNYSESSNLGFFRLMTVIFIGGG